MRPGYNAKHYGLTGKTIKIREKSDRTQMGGQSWKFPWGGLEVPVLVNSEYPEFLCCTVLPHKTLNGSGLSKPYPVSIDKFDIFRGVIVINGGSIK